MLQESVAERLKSEREKRKMTQSKLSELTGISTTQLSGYENGTRNLGIENLKLLSKALNVSCDYLLFGDGSRQPITESKNSEELIANCVDALYREGVLYAYVPRHTNYYDDQDKANVQICFSKHSFILSDLLLKLQDLKCYENSYDDPREVEKAIIRSAVKRMHGSK